VFVGRGLILSVLVAASLHAQAPTSPPTVNDVLRRAGAYALDYEQKFALLVAEERYEQRSLKRLAAGGSSSRPNPGWDSGRETKRVLKSDYLLVRLDGGGWMPFRDVFEVDGHKERNRQDRVLELFLKPSATSFEQAQRIMIDSTRYNLGDVHRTINIPTLAVLFAQPDIAARFTFAREADETVEGRIAWVFSYRERALPTLIKTSKAQDLPLSGRLWIDPDTGVIFKTHLVASDAGVSAAVTVTFRQDQELDLWVPVKMEETYHSRSNEDISCLATYANYRRFKVATDEAIRKPPSL
jgi:hypothetical protein